ncbi:Bidirectional sugar transporter SWEET14 [Platanthera zijinensis]|uniref:Bidirectional sugar transporter SWEET n=1 Tax=Platanthera zijinensis TaxID=2320716 RepID=A0AAP0B5G4_9ASPA
MVSIHIENPLAFSIGLLGNILSFIVILTPLKTFYRVYKKKTTGSFQSAPYVMALSSAILWLYYAILTRNVLLLTINTSSCVLESAYLAVYVFYASKALKIFTAKMIMFFNVVLCGSVLLLTLAFLEGRRRVEITGYICASFAVSVFIAPLSIIRLIIKTKSVEYMPFLLSLFLTLSAVAWFFYGLLLKDFFVALPNVLGFLFGVAQIILYFMYMNPKNDKSGQYVAATVVMATVGSDKDLEMAEKYFQGSEAVKPPVPEEVKVEV